MIEDKFSKWYSAEIDTTLTAPEVAQAIELTYHVTKKERIQITQQALKAAGVDPWEITSFYSLNSKELNALWLCAEEDSTDGNLRARVRAILRSRQRDRGASRTSVGSMGNEGSVSGEQPSAAGLYLHKREYGLPLGKAKPRNDESD